jgi:3-oxoacyl-[acyl-carrier protein] reductase
VESKLLKGKKIFLTGGSRGLGRSTVLELVRHGADVAFTYHSRRNEADKTLDEIKKINPGSGSRHYQLDVTDSAQVNAVAEKVAAEMGRVDVVINNAGNLRDSLVYSMSDDDWDYVLKIHLYATFYVCRAFLDEFMYNKGGRFINVASLSYTGSAGQANYSAAKAGVIGFSKALAKEYGSRDIYCNVVVPGFFKTDLTDATASSTIVKYYLRLSMLQREGDPGEFGSAIVFLASDLSSFINGEVLHVTGGLEFVPPVTERRQKKKGETS